MRVGADSALGGRRPRRLPAATIPPIRLTPAACGRWCLEARWRRSSCSIVAESDHQSPSRKFTYKATHDLRVVPRPAGIIRTGASFAWADGKSR